MVYIWLGVTVLALLMEYFTNEMISIWFAGGGLIALILSLVNVPWQITVIVFLVISVALLAFFRKAAMKYFLKGETKTNAQTALDEEFILLTEVNPTTLGTIKIGDVIWNVACKDKAQTIPAGEKVRAVAIKGNKYIVEKA